MNFSQEKQRIKYYQKLPRHIRSVYNSARRQNCINQKEGSSCLKNNYHYKPLTHFGPVSISYRNRSFVLQSKSNDWFHMKCNTGYCLVYAEISKNCVMPQSLHNASIHKIDNVTLTPSSKYESIEP